MPISCSRQSGAQHVSVGLELPPSPEMLNICLLEESQKTSKAKFFLLISVRAVTYLSELPDLLFPVLYSPCFLVELSRVNKLFTPQHIFFFLFFLFARKTADPRVSPPSSVSRVGVGAAEQQ